MYRKTAMTCFKYQVYLYGSECITHLSAILWVVTELALQEIKKSNCPHTQLRAAFPYFDWQHYTHLEDSPIDWGLVIWYSDSPIAEKHNSPISIFR